ncbi:MULTISPECIES: cystine ABC transporter substrate-binding protein [Burkholderia]|jgi:cystine transport system substrate-binding protein|uniref:Bacterial extracellular solute-binding s, 3 family protein n=2 Tax=Burkholderia gladioli TaxID=28095 RepID=A0A095VWK3_BURGA|nr:MULTISPECIES: cystine ABC transporter substrate-binding protein [Burkholderia]AEA60496.1 Extracellular solute-binding protein, family 3 [Burkholderia gladioli BSR3]AJW97322.1 bacterial extracellular solute-binding s, 3 family protein [Burkholderia gladioli]ASD79102.1 cystine ABC transporter substrate-binding protein [Burkholderia gladioli pv. gladioli]AWY55654.1 cystine ABC transporter substrate-binding protein [Burkholderia gladioli pv. gladioli]AYQ88219.1 cystine ABC transporter substrate
MKIVSLKKLLTAALIGASFVAATSHAADLLDEAKQRGTLRIGLEGTFPPFNSKAPSGELVGYDVDIAKAVAAKLGLKPEFVTTEWSGIIAGLQAGKFDVIVNQVGVTDKRKEVLDFSPAYTYSAAQLIQRKDDTRNFKSLDDLKGKKLGVGLGTNYMDMAKSVPGIDVKTYPGAPEYLRDLAAGRLDAALNDRLMLAYLLKNSQLPLRTGATLEAGQPSAIPFKKGNPKFAKAIDDAMTQLEADGTFTKISDKWFGIDVSKPLK